MAQSQQFNNTANNAYSNNQQATDNTQAANQQAEANGNQNAENQWNNGQNAENAPENNLNQQQDSNSQQSNKTNNNDEGDLASIGDDEDEYPHPESTTAWRTQQLVMSHELPAKPLMDECGQELTAIADQSGNEFTMVASRSMLAEAIDKRPILYHWCFYYNAMLLDQSLVAKNGKSYMQRYSHFIATMKKLWILARALDLSHESYTYFGYLRRRYVQISRDHFGKNLSVISAPLGDEGRVAPHLNPKGAIPRFSDY